MSVFEATHVKLKDGHIEKIVSTWGIDERRLAKPSEGGFGVITESGERVSMWEAQGYLRDKHFEDERRREEIVKEAVETADRILTSNSNGSIEELAYLTVEVSRIFAEKASNMALSSIRQTEILQRAAKVQKG